ncbi:hypothetical protein F9K97_18680 [Brucella anthropi]|uniref:hypothetical protein n=2 Tax=Brucella anthropi TaxID=529 RepID=UPI00124CFBEC|nr:hypothetical protein [Brucella anthropi]KAB2784340.1 hypothetical protein F9K97_18680 [Brucella anthropi]
MNLLKYMGAKTKVFNDDLFINSWVNFSKRSFWAISMSTNYQTFVWDADADQVYDPAVYGNNQIIIGPHRDSFDKSRTSFEMRGNSTSSICLLSARSKIKWIQNGEENTPLFLINEGDVRFRLNSSEVEDSFNDFLGEVEIIYTSDTRIIINGGTFQIAELKSLVYNNSSISDARAIIDVSNGGQFDLRAQRFVPGALTINVHDRAAVQIEAESPHSKCPIDFTGDDSSRPKPGLFNFISDKYDGGLIYISGMNPIYFAALKDHIVAIDGNPIGADEFEKRIRYTYRADNPIVTMQLIS